MLKHPKTIKELVNVAENVNCYMLLNFMTVYEAVTELMEMFIPLGSWIRLLLL